MGFAEYGDSRGFPIVYCHGSQSSRLEMHYNLSFAFKANLRLISVDRPGHGLSDFDSTGSILSFARDVKELTDYLNIHKFSVAGMSAGSLFALGISYLFPTRIYKTAIISGFAPFNKNSKKYLSKEVKVMLNLAKHLPFLLRALLRLQSKQIAQNPKKAVKGFLKIMSAPDQIILKNDSVMQVIENMFIEAFANGSQGVAHEISKILVQNWNFELSEVQVPVIFWQGQQDNNVPSEWADLMAEKIKNSDLRKHPHEGHLLIFNHAEEIFTQLKHPKHSNVIGV